MTNNSNGRLSEYFANDPPSFFDELTNNKSRPKETQPANAAESNSSNMLASTFTGSFQPPEYVEAAEADEPITVNDEVRNLWQLPTPSEPGKQPAHLITPGLHIANDLVNNEIFNYVSKSNAQLS